MGRYGAIYIAHNPRDGEHMFKVGKTERSVEERMAELTADTSNIGTYEAKGVFVVHNVDAAEAACHKRLNRYRVQPNREFFELELDRLVHAVKEETQRFAAIDIVPEPSGPPPVPSPPKSTLEKIGELEQHRTGVKERYEEAVTKAQSELERGFRIIRERATAIRDELVEFTNLSWKMASNFEEVRDAEELRDTKWGARICSVTFHSKFSGDPPVLKASGIRGGSYGEPDLSRAIEESKENGSSFTQDKEWKFVEWNEVDDGRYGRIEISGRVDATKNHSGGGRVNLVFPVRAVRIKYDDYHENWEEHYQSKDFSTPAEALDLFEELIVANASKSVIDVRQVGEQVKTGRGHTFRKIHDRGFYFFDYKKLDD